MISLIIAIIKLLLLIIFCILLLIVILISLLLFVPIRYLIKGELEEETSLIGKFSWLFSMIKLRLTYLESVFNIRVTIFGFTIFDYQDSLSMDEGENLHSKKSRKKKNENTEVPPRTNKEINLSKKDEKIEREITSLPPIRQDKPFKEKEEKFKMGQIWRLIKSKIKIFFCKLQSIGRKTKDILLSIKTKKHDIEKVYKKIKLFIHENKKGFLAIFANLKKLLYSLRPKKLNGYIEFGTGDPCQTGQVLGVMSIFYGLYNQHIKLIPNFEEKIIKGSLLIKGRIRISTFVIIGLKLFFDKNFIALMNNIKVLKEEL